MTQALVDAVDRVNRSTEVRAVILSLRGHRLRSLCRYRRSRWGHEGRIAERIARLEGLQEIHRLIADYSHGADKRELDLFLSVWHADAVWDVGTARFTGREEITAAIQRQWESQPVMAHWTANPSITLPLGSERARARVETDTMTQLSDSTWLHSAGTYHDTLEVRDGRWGFVERRAVLHFSLPVPSDSGPSPHD